jgi:hypothetical protein
VKSLYDRAEYRSQQPLNRGETDGVDPEEPAWHGGVGHQGPFG